MYLHLFTVNDSEFDWKEACIRREEQYYMWSNHERAMDTYEFREGLFAAVDCVHFMKVKRPLPGMSLFLSNGTPCWCLQLTEIFKKGEEKYNLTEENLRRLVFSIESWDGGQRWRPLGHWEHVCCCKDIQARSGLPGMLCFSMRHTNKKHTIKYQHQY